MNKFGETMRILIVEDMSDIANRIKILLAKEGYAIDIAYDGEEADEFHAVIQYDLILLDLGLPKQSGQDLLKKWRQKGYEGVIIVLTARDQWQEKVEAMNEGANDYVTKPYQAEELVARVKNHLRLNQKQFGSIITNGVLRLDTSARQVFVGDQALDLTGMQYQILSYLMHNQGRILTTEQIYDHVTNEDGNAESNSIAVMIARLRKKIGPDMIKTERGLGYRMIKS